MSRKKSQVTVLAYSRVLRLRPGQIAIVDDSPAVRGLIKSGKLELIDPPALGEVAVAEEPVSVAEAPVSVEEPVTDGGLDEGISGIDNE